MEENNNGLFWCTCCGTKNAIWGADFSFEDYGYEGEGIVSNFSCRNCGADIEVKQSFDEQE